jgi:hypothetical protein
MKRVVDILVNSVDTELDGATMASRCATEIVEEVLICHQASVDCLPEFLRDRLFNQVRAIKMIEDVLVKAVNKELDRGEITSKQGAEIADELLGHSRPIIDDFPAPWRDPIFERMRTVIFTKCLKPAQARQFTLVEGKADLSS